MDYWYVKAATTKKSRDAFTKYENFLGTSNEYLREKTKREADGSKENAIWKNK